MPDHTIAPTPQASRVQNTIAMATEFVVVSDWSPVPHVFGHGGKGGLNHETFTDLRDAEEVYREYERGEYSRARAVCVFASKHGVPIGRVL